MSRRSAMWGAAALSLVLMLLFSAVLLQPTLGSSGNAGSASGMTVDASSAAPGDDAVWEDDEDEGDDDDEGRYEEHEGGEDEDGYGDRDRDDD